MNFHNLTIKEVEKQLNTTSNGLSKEEVIKRLNEYGKNKLTEEKKESNFKKFLNQFNDLMIIILLLAAALSLTLSLINNEEVIDSIIIIAIVLLNTTLSFIQEQKANKSIEALKKLQVTKVKVKRENQITIINSIDIVPGDILILEAGDTIPADARIIWEASLKVDEASLTGESIPVKKTTTPLNLTTPLSERNNMIYSGTNIVYGKCQAIVCNTGMNTEFGLIAKSLNNSYKEITPLQKKINGISKFLSIIIAIIILIMFFIGIIKGMPLMEIIMLSISLAVAAIPEGLPTVITITLALGMNTMAKRKAIIRRMSSVETLGCTEIICSDKTGTITQNKMTVREIFYNNKLYNIEELNTINPLFKNMILNNDALKTNNEYIGDPTEIALLECLENKLNIEEIKKENQRTNEIPFDSERKMMSTINQNKDKTTIYTKGSFDSIINNCSYIYENDKIIKLTEEKKNYLKQIEIKEANKAYRILAFAYKDIQTTKYEENDLIFIGMTAMIDPPRIDVKEAISCCKNANIKPIMITGDSLATAKTIAKEIGILENDNEAITGIELDKIPEYKLKDEVKKYTVYARVSPLNKLAIVNAWKQNNKVVAMTGDGVNDAPSLKAADIGIGMGITGTEVSKEVSDIILANDSFSTIVTAVKEGRRIFDNIRNVLVYLLTGNITEILVVFIGMLFGIEIFLPIQLLYINLITDGVPAIALAFEKEEKNIMNREIRKKDSSFFTPFLISKITISSIFKTTAILLIYFISTNKYNTNIASTMAFLTLIILEMIFSYSCRNIKQTILNKKIFNNKELNKSIIILTIIQILIFTTPASLIFKITNLTLSQISLCLIVSLSIFLIDEFSKNMIQKNFKD